MLDASVWAKEYWFVLRTVALHYPDNPNATAKKKYYDLVQNLPLFVPDGSALCASLLDRYPVAPYLDGRDSFLRWVDFIRNRVHIATGAEPITRQQAAEEYAEYFAPPPDLAANEARRRRTIATVGVSVGLLGIAVFLALRGEILEL
tara:strand:- start:55 stop:495 length:441 start_codon:yes stop_codon:yes gene_type:complete